jgi:hypothetical protein
MFYRLPVAVMYFFHHLSFRLLLSNGGESLLRSTIYILNNKICTVHIPQKISRPGIFLWKAIQN